MKMLFADTEFDGWIEGRSHYEDYAGRPLECLAFYQADFLGLDSWFKREDKIDFTKYDLIWCYLGHRAMSPSWFTFPRLIKRKAPNVKVVFTADFEGLWFDHDFDLRIKLAWDEADVMHVITRFGEQFFKDHLNIPVVYGTFGRPYAGGIKSLPRPFPISKRSGICFIRHTNIPQILTQMEVIKQMKMKAIGIDSVPQPFSDGSYIPFIAVGFNVKGEFYPRLRFDDYLDVLRESYVGLDNHVGPSRFAYENSLLQVPVVHSEMSEYANILFPDLTCAHDNVDEMVNMIKRLRADKAFYTQSINKATDILHTYYSVEECQKRLDEFIEGIMK